MCTLCNDANHSVNDKSPFTAARRSALKKLGAGGLWASMGGLFMPSASAAPDVIPKPNNLLTPDQALTRLVNGNKRFVQGAMTPFNVIKERGMLVDGQNPFACVLACADSRVSPEFVFDEELGDLFVTRVAGNYVTNDILASLEYAVAELNAPLIMVMGHTECGAIKAAIKAFDDDYDFPGHIQVITSALARAVRVGRSRKEDIARTNVKLNVINLIDATPVISKYVSQGRVKIVGGLYDLKTGNVEIVT